MWTSFRGVQEAPREFGFNLYHPLFGETHLGENIE